MYDTSNTLDDFLTAAAAKQPAPGAFYNTRTNAKEVPEPADRAAIEGAAGDLLANAGELIQDVAPRIWERDTREDESRG